MFSKVLIANRGEIAVRVIRSLRELDITSVAVYSDADAKALHVRMADEAYHIGPAPSSESYLVWERILEVAKKSGAEAIHPGYGFLSENAAFSKAVRDAGLVFIGPREDAINVMGDKVAARACMIAAKVPVVPGTEDPVDSAEAAQGQAESIGFPLMLKAAAGGGGKGMRKVDDPKAFASSFEAAQREAQNAFGDGRIYLERFVENPRHIEVQVFADQHGNVLHLFERECSIQRRHQKVIEESPSPFISPETRARICEAAVKATQAVDYEGAGTIEFLCDAEQNFYFLEMNTRLQVEHPVTEMVTGIDLVKLQLRVAAGEKLPFAQADITQKGWAIEARVYAEDPESNFMPSPGKIRVLSTPSGPGVRDDSGVYEGAVIPMEYDPMISKLVCWGSTREEAIGRLRRALMEYRVLGVKTNISFHHALLQHPDFIAGNFDTGFLERVDVMAGAAVPEDEAQLAQLAAVLLAHRAAVTPAGKSANQDRSVPASAWRLAGRREAQRGV